MIGTITSRARTVAFFLITITAEITTRTTVVTNGEIPKAFSNDDATELLMTWLSPPQQIRPDSANRSAITERFSFFFLTLSA